MFRKWSLGFAAILATAVLLWLAAALASGSDQLTFGIDRTSSGYQSQEFIPEFNAAVTTVEKILYDTNHQYSLFWRLKRVVIAVGALAGIGAAALSFVARHSGNKPGFSAVATLGVVFGLVSALCPPTLSYIDSEAETYLVKSKELKASIDSSLIQARAKPELTQDLILELNALVAKSS